MWNDSLSYFNEESITSFKILVANIQWEQLKAELVQIKAEWKEIKELEKISEDFLKLVQITWDIMSKYVETKDEQTLLEIKSNIEKIKSYKPIFETKLTWVARDNSLQTIVLMETKYNEFVLAKN